MSAGHNSVRVIIIALFANLGIALAKTAGAIFTHSAALFAEAIHSFVDCTNQIFLLIGRQRAQRPPSPTHPLGYGREMFFWSFMVAILLFSMGGLFAIYEGTHKLAGHEPLRNPEVALLILIFSIALESYSFYACLREVRASNRYASLGEWIRKSTASDLVVIFLEDAAALLGLVLALISLLIAWISGQSFWDGVGSIAVGVLLIVVAVTLAIEIKSLLVGERSETDFRPSLEEFFSEEIPGAKIFNLISLQIGAHEVMLSCKFSTGAITDVTTLLKQINLIERRMRERFPELKWLFFEPDKKD